MSKSDNDNGQIYHVRLSSYEREVLDKMHREHGISRTAAIKMLIRSGGIHVGFKRPDE